MKTRLLDWIARMLLAHATPYFHLYGYMMRWWLVPYSQVLERHFPADPFGDAFTTTDGTGPVAFRQRPLAWLIQKLGLAIRVHEILRSDIGRDPHDHPWPYLTVVLRGGYWESRYDAGGVLIGHKWHAPGSILYRPASSWHMLHLPTGQTCTTLFITGKKAQRWGFIVNGQKVPYDRYPGRN